MRDGRLLGAGGHLERTQEDGDERRQLLDVLLLTLHHPEHDAVPFAHALGVLRPDVLVDDLLPASATQPAAEKALNLKGGCHMGYHMGYHTGYPTKRARKDLGYT